MVKVTFEGTYGAITLNSDAAPYVLTSIDGLGGVDGQLYTAQTPLRDGVMLNAATAQPRTINISGAVVGGDERRAELRRALQRRMNVKNGAGVITIEGYGRARQIEGIVERGPVFEENEGEGMGYQQFTMVLYCPQPFFCDTQENAQGMETVTGGAAFPIKLPIAFATRYSASWFEYENAGDAPCAIEAEFTPGASNPILTNSATGEYIRLRRTIPTGKHLIINTTFGKKSVVLRDMDTGEESDAMGYIDLKSTFFELQPGRNLLNFGAESGAADTQVMVRWRARYAGF